MEGRGRKRRDERDERGCSLLHLCFHSNKGVITMNLTSQLVSIIKYSTEYFKSFIFSFCDCLSSQTYLQKFGYSNNSRILSKVAKEHLLRKVKVGN